jgi:peptidoglycan hydrolase-like protein with peptidoglycan-binding domain
MTPRQARVAFGTFVLLAAGVTGNALYLQGRADRLAAKPAAAPPARQEPQRQPSRPAEGKSSHQTSAASPTMPPKAAEAKIAEPKPSEPKPSEPKPSEPKVAERKTAEPEAPDVSRDAGSPKNAQALKVRTVRVATIGEAPSQNAGPAETRPDADTVRAVQAELDRRGYGPVTADGVMRPAARAAIMAFEHEHRLPLTGEPTQELLKLLLFGAPPAAGAAGPPEVRSPQAQALIKQVQRQLAERGYGPAAADGRLSAETVAAIRTFEADQGLVPKGRISALVLDRLESGMGGGGRHRDP